MGCEEEHRLKNITSVPVVHRDPISGQDLLIITGTHQYRAIVKRETAIVMTRNQSSLSHRHIILICTPMAVTIEIVQWWVDAQVPVVTIRKTGTGVLQEGFETDLEWDILKLLNVTTDSVKNQVVRCLLTGAVQAATTKRTFSIEEGMIHNMLIFHPARVTWAVIRRQFQTHLSCLVATNRCQTAWKGTSATKSILSKAQLK